MKLTEWRAKLDSEEFYKALYPLYKEKTKENIPRYAALLDRFEKSFPDAAADADILLFSAPGRTEIGGNHTDHQRGRVLAASVEMDSIGAAAAVPGTVIDVRSEGFDPCQVDISDLQVREDEFNTTMSLIRGMAAGFAQRGCKVGAFCMTASSNVLPGSGISSSASFEVLLGNVINTLFFDGKEDAVEIAKLGQYAENVYFGKPSGLLDQMACSVGNLLTIDFENKENPLVKKLDVNFDSCGLALCIIDSGADHAGLTSEYAAIPEDLRAISGMFGKEVLREIDKEEFYANFGKVRAEVGDRAILRAVHFYDENERVAKEAEALESGNVDEFLRLVRMSGYSSYMYLQDIVPAGRIKNQEMGVTLAMCHEILGERGAFRVHGGGFAGTAEAFVPLDMVDTFKASIEQLLGTEGCCHVINIREVGGTAISL